MFTASLDSYLKWGNETLRVVMGKEMQALLDGLCRCRELPTLPVAPTTTVSQEDPWE